jgi:hypothetical protein
MAWGCPQFLTNRSILACDIACDISLQNKWQIAIRQSPITNSFFLFRPAPQQKHLLLAICDLLFRKVKTFLKR